MPVRSFDDGQPLDLLCGGRQGGGGPQKYLLSFQGRATHNLRLELAGLDNGHDVRVRVLCVLPNQSHACISQGYSIASLEHEPEGEGRRWGCRGVRQGGSG